MEFNLNKDILSHNNVPLENPKCTPRGTCTPVWEPLLYAVAYRGFLKWVALQSQLNMLSRKIFQMVKKVFTLNLSQFCRYCGNLY